MSKQDDFSRNEGDPVIASVPIATSHKRSVTAESPITNAKSCSKGDMMSSEIVDIGSPPLTPKTPHTPTDFKTQALHFPLLVCLFHCSTSCVEQCEVTFHRRLQSIPLKIKRPVQVRLRVSDMTAPLAVLPQHSQQPDRCPSKIPQHTESCTTICMHVRHLPLPSSEQPPPSIPQYVAPVRTPNSSIPLYM